MTSATKIRTSLDDHDDIGRLRHWRVTLVQSFRIALRSMAANLVRTGLTLLGMIIGVGAVICSVGLGSGAALKIQKQYENMGKNMLITHTSNPRLRFDAASTGAVTSMKLEDAELMALKFRETIVRVAPTYRGNAMTKFGNKNWFSTVVGVTPDYGEVNKHPAAKGRFITNEDVVGRTKVAVVGATVVEQLFGERDANVIGQHLDVNRIKFKIVGVLKQKGTGAFGQDEDSTVLVPLGTAMRRLFNVTYLSGINIECRDKSKMALAEEQVRNFYRERHKVHPPFQTNDDFHVHNQGMILQLTAGASTQLTAMLTGIAVVSLVVGGVGIMNIMLVTVNERTREIGLRKAVGATSAQILLQFLIEAVVVSFSGGGFGVGFGLGVAALLTNRLGWVTVITLQSVIMAAGVSAAIGVVFGIYPAWKAAQLHPIEALRYE